jgi:hypothetical protein
VKLSDGDREVLLDEEHLDLTPYFDEEMLLLGPGLVRKE